MEQSQCRGSAALSVFVLLFLLCISSSSTSTSSRSILRVVGAAGTVHQVGGAPGWTLPSVANVNYTMWASTQTFDVGDTLYFNYSKEYHNVLQVTEADYESCNAASPIMQWDDGATKIALNSSATFYYLCGKPTHCTQGQKVMVDVKAASKQHQVGGTPGWSLPSLAKVNYTVWASSQTFMVGDTLYFNYSKQYHNVLQVTEANYESCNATGPIHTWDDGATVITLNTTGTFYYICGIPTHCSQGQKVAVLVQSTSNGTGPASSPNGPASSPKGSPASSQSITRISFFSIFGGGCLITIFLAVSAYY